jgi:hypothetical protein
LVSPAQRTAIERYIASVSKLFNQTPLRDASWSKRSLVAITKLLMALAGSQEALLSIDAKGEAYMVALDDVPCWATEEATRMWFRGACGSQHNYTWPPAPAILRSVARARECELQWTSTQLQQLLVAEEGRVLSEEHCAIMRARLGQLIPANLQNVPKRA